MANKTQWLTTADGKIRLTVLKQFDFNVPVKQVRNDGVDLITSNSRRFLKGTHLLDPQVPEDAAVLAHPWVHQYFADGHIENPNVTCERLERESAAAKAEDERRAQLQAEADQILDRSTVAAASQAISSEDMQAELNTPLNQLRQRSGGKRSGKTPDTN